MATPSREKPKEEEEEEVFDVFAASPMESLKMALNYFWDDES